MKSLSNEEILYLKVKIPQYKKISCKENKEKFFLEIYGNLGINSKTKRKAVVNYINYHSNKSSRVGEIESNVKKEKKKKFIQDIDDFKSLNSNELNAIIFELNNKILEMKCQITQLNREIQNLKNIKENEKWSYIVDDVRLFTIAVISEGMTYMQAKRFLCKFNIKCPSSSMFYKCQNELNIQLEKYVFDHLNYEQSRIKYGCIVSFDASWDHPRWAQRCFGALINTESKKIIDYYLLYRKMRGHDGNTESYPQGMETEILRKLGGKWAGDERIECIVQDTDNNNSKVFIDLNWNVYHLIDKNHLKKNY